MLTKVQKRIVTKAPFLGSSTDESKVALTVKGILTALVPIIIAVSATSGVALAETDLLQFVETVTALIAGGMMLIGIVRKIAKAIKNR